MTNLFDYIKTSINESTFPTPADGERYIKVCLNYLSKEDLDEVAALIHQKMGDKDIEKNANAVRSNLAERLDNRKLNYFRKTIEYALNKGKDYENLATYYLNGKLITIDDVLKSGNISKYISDNVGISNDTVRRLYEVSGGPRPSVGKGEILLDLVCADIDKESEGDVAFKSGRNFELKGWGGAVLYEQMWKNKELTEMRNAFWEGNEGSKRSSSQKINPEFEKLLVKETGIHNYDDLNKVWGAYIISLYAAEEGFTDLIVGDYLEPDDYFWIPVGKSVKEIYNTIKNLPVGFDWPAVHGASGGSLRCAIKKTK